MMNYKILDLQSLGLYSFEANQYIHNQSLYEAIYLDKSQVLIGFMYGSHTLPSNNWGEDIVRIYLKSDENIDVDIPVRELTIGRIVEALNELGYTKANPYYRKILIDDILKDLE